MSLQIEQYKYFDTFDKLMKHRFIVLQVSLTLSSVVVVVVVI
jgi:hypothetical protein